MVESLRGIVEQRRKPLLIIVAVIAVYAVLGFFLAPYLVKQNAIQAVDELYGAELRIEKVAVNPFVLSLRVDGIEMDDPDGNEFASLEQFYINFQLSSLFRWALTFAEIRFDVPEVVLRRRAIGDTNFAFLLAGSEENAPAEVAAEDPSIPRLVVHQFKLNEASLHWDDAVPREPVVTTFGPVNAHVQDLSTLPQQEGQQEVVITTETTGTLSWSGSLQLNPLRSAGSASIVGSHFPLTSAYLKDPLGFDAVEGDADISLDYSIDTLADGQLDIDVNNLKVVFSDVLLRTYGRESTDGSDADRDVMQISRFSIDGGTLRMPEQTASIGAINLEDSELSVYRNASGDLNVMPVEQPAESAEVVAEPTNDADVSAPWSLSLDEIDVSQVAINFIDDSVTPQASLGIRNLDINIADISNEAGARFPTQVSLVTQNGGAVSLDGELAVLPEPAIDLQLAMSGIPLAFLHPYVTSLADVRLDSGALGMNARLLVDGEEAFGVTGDMAITDFLITETERDTRLGSWDNISTDQFALSLSKETLDISEIQIDKAYGDVRITEDGSVNLGRVALGEQVVDEEEAEAASDEQAEQAAAEPPEPESLPLAITIGRVIVNDAAADFEDRSLPLPFDVSIAALNGTLTTIASNSTEPSAATLEGKVDEFGLVRVSGTITPLQPPLDTDIKVDFENVDMPKFSAYSVPFAGREIESGKLDLFLGYRLENGSLVGENKIVMRDFELGDEVDHPDASSLPLGLAVALLKGPDGTIDIDLPVRGDVNDPSFKYGSVVGEALTNLIVKIVASPFALLGKLVGVEANELEYIAFQDGRADLTPPEQEKIVKLAEALAMRPELSIEIYGVINREADGRAMRTARVDEELEQEIDAESGGDEQYAEQRLKAIEAKFGEPDVRNQLKEEFTGEDGLDELAYATALRDRLIEAYMLDETDFISLARRRASSVQAGLLEANASLESQFIVGELQEVSKDADESIQMKVELAANNDG